jgi:hypothetical protein
MQGMTLEQLRTASQTGGVSSVTLKGQGGGFLVQITTRTGTHVVLAKARSSEPRRFGNPAAALNVLRDLGITVGRFDASEWDPAARGPVAHPSDRRAAALRKAHAAAVHNEWLAAEIQAAIDDPRPNVAHDTVLAEMDTDIAALEAEQRPVGSQRARAGGG